MKSLSRYEMKPVAMIAKLATDGVDNSGKWNVNKMPWMEGN
jgi:hypothetical protein